MSGLNRATILGRLGSDPDVKTLQGGNTVATLSIATSEKWKDKNSGQDQERTEWHRVVVWGKGAEIIQKYVKKGQQLYIEGKLQTRKWDKDGVTMYTTEIVATNFVLIGGGGSGSGRPPGPTENDYNGPSFDSSEEIPF